ncbi:MAG: glycosyltransferase family 2 protein [Rhizobiaceae bacterium]
MPRFTIVVPTRNRPGELVLTLETLRQLRNADVSILVSDNSDAALAEQNRRNVETALAGTAFSYVRPARSMNMVDHWNFAVGHADGDYVGIVSDRLTLVPAALEIIDRVIRETGAECVCWAATIFDTGNSEVHKPHGSRVEADIKSSQEILQRFAASEMVWISPRFLNSFCSRRALEAIKARHGEYFGGISPDFSFSFRLLSTIDEYVYIDAPLLIDHSPHCSNGTAVTNNRDNAHSRDFLARMHAEQKSQLAFGPMPFEGRLLPNVVLREMEICRAEAGAVASIPPVDPARFYRACLKFLRRFARFSDAATQETARHIETYRKAHGLGRPGILMSVRVQYARLRNTMRHSREAARAARTGPHPATDWAALKAALMRVPVSVEVEYPSGLPARSTRVSA